MVKNLPAMQKMQVQSLGWEESLEKEMAPTPVFLPEELCGQRSLAGYSPWGRKELDTTERLHLHFHFHGLFEGKNHVECVSMFPAPNIVPGSNRFSMSLWVNMLINLC